MATGCMKSHHGKVRMSQWSLPSAGVCWSFRGLCALLIPITMPLGSTQACFNSWKPCCVSAFFPKEHSAIITAQVASVFRNFSARAEGAEEQRLLWTLLCLGPLRHPLIALCMSSVCLVFCHLESRTFILRAICSSGVDLSTAIDNMQSFQACERFQSSNTSANNPSEMSPADCQWLVSSFTSVAFLCSSHRERKGTSDVVSALSHRGAPLLMGTTVLFLSHLTLALPAALVSEGFCL